MRLIRKTTLSEELEKRVLLRVVFTVFWNVEEVGLCGGAGAEAWMGENQVAGTSK